MEALMRGALGGEHPIRTRARYKGRCCACAVEIITVTADLVNRRDAALFRHCSRRAIQEPDHYLQAIVGGDMLHLAQQLASRLRERNILAPTWPNGVRMCWHVCATDAWE